MKDITIVRIKNLEQYAPYAKKYGILQQVLPMTAVVNFDSNMGGVCINIAHEDYALVPTYAWELINGEVVISGFCGGTHTGLKIWK